MHVHVNAAMSADGKLSSRRREQLAISGDVDFARVDRLRAEHDAVMVGVGTVLADDPSLVRHDEARRAEVCGPDAGPPARVVADSRARTPLDAAVLQGEPTTFVLVSRAAEQPRLDALRSAGARVVVAGEDRVDLTRALDRLGDAGVGSLMVEGGGELIYSLFADDLVDVLTTYVGPLVVGGRNAPTLADGEGFVEDFPGLALRNVEELDDGVLLAWDVEG